jgi:glycosyltransferase involved in cell wall biosynthesis
MNNTVTSKYEAIDLGQNVDLWHILSVSSIPVREFAMAMHQFAPTLAWVPSMSKTGLIQSWTRSETCNASGLREIHFPLQRGYARGHVERWARPSRLITRRLLEQSADSRKTALVCTSPFWAPIAEAWPGPVVYYVTDLMVAYEGLKASQVRELDTLLCRVASLVCPNSERISEYLQTDANCNPGLIQLIPNATRSSNIRQISAGPENLPADVAHLRRPVAGIIGNLAGNIDWNLLLDAVEQTPLYTWLMIGPVSMTIKDLAQRRARELTLRHPRVRNIGFRPYESLRDYARAFDVAVLPYRQIEPTWSGSSTRFYEHLAACRPMISTHGVEELISKQPLTLLVRSGAEMASELNRLASSRGDGLEEARRKASMDETWEVRAVRMISALREIRKLHLVRSVKTEPRYIE